MFSIYQKIPENSGNFSGKCLSVKNVFRLTHTFHSFSDSRLRPMSFPPKLAIDSCVSVRSSRYEARGEFGEHERCVRVARGVAESNSSFLIQRFSRGLSWYVRRGCLHGGRKILHSNNYRFVCEFVLEYYSN